MTDDRLSACLARIDVLLAKMEALADGQLRGDVQEIVQCLLDYHGAALGRLVGLLTADGGWPRERLQTLATDELVGSLLLLHELHPADLETRVAEALERARPLLASHGGNVELARIEDATVYVRLHGNCHGCLSSLATLKSHIEQAVFATAPDVAAVAIEDETLEARATGGFVSVDQLTLSR